MSTQIIGENLMKTKILSVILSAIILSTSAAILVGCGDEKESVAKIATSDGAATKIETVTEVATDEQGSTQIVEETRVIEETTTTNFIFYQTPLFIRVFEDFIFDFTPLYAI